MRDQESVVRETGNARERLRFLLPLTEPMTGKWYRSTLEPTLPSSVAHDSMLTTITEADASLATPATVLGFGSPLAV